MGAGAFSFSRWRGTKKRVDLAVSLLFDKLSYSRNIIMGLKTTVRDRQTVVDRIIEDSQSTSESFILLKGMLKIFFTGLDNFILLRCMG